MQDIHCQEKDQMLSNTKEIYYGTTHVRKKYHHYMYLKTKDSTKESPYSTKKVPFVATLSRRTYFWDTAVPCGSKNSHNVVQLNPDEDKHYLLTPNLTLMPPKFRFTINRYNTLDQIYNV